MVRLTASLLTLFVLACTLPAEAQGRARGLGRFGGPAAATGQNRSDQEPAFARGYADGFKHAQEDRRDRRGYDPVAHREYRDADQGYSRTYGSREAYKDNYRAGFRSGYDAGYRDGSGRRR